jgi:hypothetical protein
MMPSFPMTFSIVIEWDNALLSESIRARRMLVTLDQQMAALPRTVHRPQVLIVYDALTVDGHLLQHLVCDTLKSRDIYDVELVPGPGLHYYELKNLGATRAHGEVIVFLDSDVIPEEGWLLGLLRAFESPAVHVVCGNTYIELEGLYSKAFALFWFFSPRVDSNGLVPVESFYANNVAFRREIFQARPYPTVPLFRAQFVTVVHHLKQRGIVIWLQQGSRVSHPPPNGLEHFICRALAQGYDAVMTEDLTGIRSSGNSFSRYRDALGRIRERHREVGLGRGGALGAATLATGYYTLHLLGELLTRVHPALVRRYFPT